MLGVQGVQGPLLYEGRDLNEGVCLGIDDRLVLHSGAHNDHGSDIKHIRLIQAVEAASHLTIHFSPFLLCLVVESCREFSNVIRYRSPIAIAHNGSVSVDFMSMSSSLFPYRKALPPLPSPSTTPSTKQKQSNSLIIFKESESIRVAITLNHHYR